MDITSIYSFMYQELFPYLTGRDIVNLSQVNSSFKKASSDDKLWEGIVTREFLSLKECKSDYISWKRFYIGLIKSPQVMIWYYEATLLTPLVIISIDLLVSYFARWQVGFMLNHKNNIYGCFTPDSRCLNLDPNQTTSIILIDNYYTIPEFMVNIRKIDPIRNSYERLITFEPTPCSQIYYSTLIDYITLYAGIKVNIPSNCNLTLEHLFFEHNFNLCQFAHSLEQLGLIDWSKI